MDEPACLWCGTPIRETDRLKDLMTGTCGLCAACLEKLDVLSFCCKVTAPARDGSGKESGKSGRKSSRKLPVHIVYEDNAGFRDFYTRFALQHDVELAPLFLLLAPAEISWLSAHLCISAAPLASGYERSGLDALQAILSAHDLVLHHPVQNRQGRLVLSEELERMCQQAGKKKKKVAAILLEWPSREDLLYNPVLQQADALWILCGHKPTLAERLQNVFKAICKDQHDRGFDI